MAHHTLAPDITHHIQTQYAAQPEYLWARTPNNAVFRHGHNRRWFAALLVDVPVRVLGLPGDGRADLLDLKLDPRMVVSLPDGKGFFPGYHMNKAHWITVLLDGTVPLEEIYPLIALSYDRTK